MIAPPPPPGDFLEWIFELTIFLAILIIAVYVAIHLLKETKGITTTTSTSRQQIQLEEVMKDLLDEMRKLRKEIEELRRELKE